jgi:hypothetical protein
MLCRSQAATAVCVPGDARSMVAGRRADRTIIAEDARLLHDVRYVRLGAGGGCDGAGATRVSSSRRTTAAPRPPPMPRRRGAPVAVTLPMVTKSPKETPAKDAAAAKRTPATLPTAAAVAPGDQVLQVRTSSDQRIFCSSSRVPRLHISLHGFGHGDKIDTHRPSLQISLTVESAQANSDAPQSIILFSCYHFLCLFAFQFQFRLASILLLNPILTASLKDVDHQAKITSVKCRAQGPGITFTRKQYRGSNFRPCLRLSQN